MFYMHLSLETSTNGAWVGDGVFLAYPLCHIGWAGGVEVSCQPQIMSVKGGGGMQRTETFTPPKNINIEQLWKSVQNFSNCKKLQIISEELAIITFPAFLLKTLLFQIVKNCK